MIRMPCWSVYRFSFINDVFFTLQIWKNDSFESGIYRNSRIFKITLLIGRTFIIPMYKNNSLAVLWCFYCWLLIILLPLGIKGCTKEFNEYNWIILEAQTPHNTCHVNQLVNIFSLEVPSCPWSHISPLNIWQMKRGKCRRFWIPTFSSANFWILSIQFVILPLIFKIS